MGRKRARQVISAPVSGIEESKDGQLNLTTLRSEQLEKIIDSTWTNIFQLFKNYPSIEQAWEALQTKKQNEFKKDMIDQLKNLSHSVLDLFQNMSSEMMDLSNFPTIAEEPKAKRAKRQTKKQKQSEAPVVAINWALVGLPVWKMIFEYIGTYYPKNFSGFRLACKHFRSLTNSLFWRQKLPKCQVRFYFLQCRMLGIDTCPSIIIKDSCYAVLSPLPSTITTLSFQDVTNLTEEAIRCISSSITDLDVRCVKMTNEKLKEMPPTIKKLQMTSLPDHGAKHLPPNLEELKLSECKHVNSFPTTLRKLSIDHMTKVSSLPPNLKELEIVCPLSQLLKVLPNTLQKLWISNANMNNDEITALTTSFPKLSIIIDGYPICEWIAKTQFKHYEPFIKSVVDKMSTKELYKLLLTCKDFEFFKYVLENTKTFQEDDGSLLISVVSQVHGYYIKAGPWIQLLLDCGADVNQCDPSGAFPLCELVKHYSSKENVLLLISKGADVNRMDAKKSTPLYCAAEIETMEALTELIKAGADINFIHPVTEMTPLYVAVFNSHYRATQVLLSNGADPSIHPKQHPSLALLAIEKGSSGVIKTLLDFKISFNEYSTNGLHPLHLLTQADKLSCLRVLLEAGADPNVRTKDSKSTPLMFAQSKEIAKCLVEHKADLKIKDARGYTYEKYVPRKVKMVLKPFLNSATQANPNSSDDNASSVSGEESGK